jgi:hypothetical protein
MGDAMTYARLGEPPPPPSLPSPKFELNPDTRAAALILGFGLSAVLLFYTVYPRRQR